MIFDQPPAELPVATLRPRDSGAQLLLDVRTWLASKWRWLKPRSIPVAVAFAGMLAVLASASYLRDLAHQPPEQLPAPVLSTWHADGPLARIRVESHAGDAGTFVAKRAAAAEAPAAVPSSVVKIVTVGELVELSPGVYQVRLEPVAPAASAAR